MSPEVVADQDHDLRIRVVHLKQLLDLVSLVYGGPAFPDTDSRNVGDAPVFPGPACVSLRSTARGVRPWPKAAFSDHRAGDTDPELSPCKRTNAAFSLGRITEHVFRWGLSSFF